MESGHLMVDLLEALRSARVSSEFMAWVRRNVPEIAILKQSKERLEHHPEGDSWAHMELVMARAFEMPCSDAAKVAALFHDLGKTVTAGLLPHPKTGAARRCSSYVEKYSHLGHDEFGALMMAPVLSRYVDLEKNPELLALCEDVARYHIRSHKLCDAKGEQAVTDKAVRNLIESMGYQGWTDTRKADFFAATKSDAIGRKSKDQAEWDERGAQTYAPETVMARVSVAPIVEYPTYQNPFVAGCIANIKRIDPAYWQSTLNQRTDPVNKAGSYYKLTASELESKLLDCVHWKEFQPLAGVVPNCRYFRAPIAGFNGMALLKSRENTTPVLLRDVKQTGELSALIDGGMDDYVAEPFTTLIAGKEDGKWVVFTLHPGLPVAPSGLRANNEVSDGMVITAKKARKLGFDLAKIADLPELRATQTITPAIPR